MKTVNLLFNKALKRVKRNAIFAIVILYDMYEGFVCAQSSSASLGTSAISEATSDIKSFYDPIKKMIWIIAAIIGLIGAVKVYSKIMGKDPESTKHGAAFLFGAIALVALETFIRKMFMENT